MGDLEGQSVLVAGAGVMGLAAAAALSAAGARVTICDPADSLDSASGVAAGMLAPVFESGLDAEAGAGLTLLRAARDRWPSFLAALGLSDIVVDRSGAALLVREPDRPALAELARRLSLAGAAVESVPARELAALQPGLSPDLAEGLFTPEDWRLSPRPVLAALSRAVIDRGGAMVRAPLETGPAGLTVGGERVSADAVVIATGARSALFAPLAPELAVLAPIKGQILHFQAGPRDGPSLRDLEGYVVPQGDGAVAGATMEFGRDDRVIDPDVTARLRARAARLLPALATAPARGLAGVRAATPDGAPMVGPSVAGLWLTAGARRNGWLLAPLAAEILVERMAGGEGGPWARALDPGRFGAG